MNVLADLVPDLPLLRKAVEWVEVEALKPRSEREWDQMYYRLPAESRSEQEGVDCGTAYCVAGYVCYLAGCEWFSDFSHALLSEGGVVDEVAAKLLGIAPPVADHLFEASNTAADIRRIAGDIAEQAGEKL